MRKPLPLIQTRQEGLGAPTIMDRALAEQHGSRYVQLAVFAIDVDRVCQAHSDNEALPLGWEVFVTEALLVALVDPTEEAQHSMLEDACLDLLVDQADARLGSQLPFAVYDAVVRGVFPESLKPLFHRWRTPSKSLLRDLADFWQARDQALPKLVELCLNTPLSPPLAPPTVEALQKLALQNPAVRS
jgi:hypothetical protein